MKKLGELENIIVPLSKSDKVGKDLALINGYSRIERLLLSGHHPFHVIRSLKEPPYGFILDLFVDALRMGDEGLKEEMLSLLPKMREVEGVLSEYAEWMKLLKFKTVLFVLVGSVFSAVMASTHPLLVRLMRLAGGPVGFASVYVVPLYWVALLFSSGVSSMFQGDGKFTSMLMLISTAVFWALYYTLTLIFGTQLHS